MGNQQQHSSSNRMKRVGSFAGSRQALSNIWRMAASNADANSSYAESETERVRPKAATLKKKETTSPKATAESTSLKTTSNKEGPPPPQPKPKVHDQSYAPRPPPGPPPPAAPPLAPRPSSKELPPKSREESGSDFPTIPFAQTPVAPPPRRQSTRIQESWYNKTYMKIAHLGRINEEMFCPSCRNEIPPTVGEDPRRMSKFTTCPKCELKWPTVVTRMIPKRPGSERWIRDVDHQSRLCWARMLKAGDEERLYTLLEAFNALERREIESRLDLLDSHREASMSTADLALQLAIATAWNTREFDPVAYCRRFSPSGILEWQPAAENVLETMQDLKELKITAEIICQLREVATLSQRITWFREQLGLLRTIAMGEEKVAPLTIKVRRDCVLEDASTCFMTIRPKELYRTCRYEFIDEQAIDAGGVAREFFSLASAQTFDANLGLFESLHTADGLFVIVLI